MIASSNAPHLYDVVVVGATPGGIMAAIAAAREGLSVVILERTSHVGGLPANGLGATDISTREAAGGLFKDFTDRIRETYRRTYGVDSEQYVMCSEGFHFEPSVAEKVLEEMLGEHPSIEVRRRPACFIGGHEP
jgi:flavin-dependent dehydrogenase